MLEVEGGAFADLQRRRLVVVRIAFLLWGQGSAACRFGVLSCLRPVLVFLASANCACPTISIRIYQAAVERVEEPVEQAIKDEGRATVRVAPACVRVQWLLLLDVAH